MMHAASLTRFGVHVARPGERAVALFHSYLFRPGGAYSLAICRIGLFSYLYVHVYRGAVAYGLGNPDYYTTVNVAAYHAKSLVYLLFTTAPPPVEFLQITLAVAGISTICAIVGFLTRIAMVVSVLTLTFLGAMIFAWEPLWSHPYNSGLLAGIGFMFGRAGDVLSVDAVITRYVLRRPIAIDRRVYWWPIILGLFGTASVYFGGFYAKWSTTDWTYTLSWAFSDNLRNAASLPWLIYGKPLPFQVELLVNNPWLWKTAALGHLATQALPIFALLSLNKPYVRLVEGLIFVSGVALLKAVMGFWNPEWMILGVFFVDWEYFLRKAGLRFPSTEPARKVAHPAPIMAYAFAFMAANLIIIGIRYDDRGSSRLFPFSSMNFYSNVSAGHPYGEHKHYPFPYGELIITYGDGTTRKYHCYSAIAKRFNTVFSNSIDSDTKLPIQLGEITAAHNVLAAAKGHPISDCYGMVQTDNIVAIDHYASILDIPPYPEKVRFEVGHRALIGRYERDGERFMAASGSVRGLGTTVAIDVRSQSLDVDRYEILLANDPWKNYKIGPYLKPGGTWKDESFEMDPAFYQGLRPGWYPVVVRVTEKSGRSYDFFGGVVYR